MSAHLELCLPGDLNFLGCGASPITKQKHNYSLTWLNWITFNGENTFFVFSFGVLFLCLSFWELPEEQE